MRFKPGDKVIRRETWEVKQERLGRYDITMPSAFPPVLQSMIVKDEEIIDADALNYFQYKKTLVLVQEELQNAAAFYPERMVEVVDILLPKIATALMFKSGK